jgi:hypothetical protein
MAGQWFSQGPLVSSTSKTDRHDINLQRNFSTILQIKLVSYIISQYDFSEKKIGPFYLPVYTCRHLTVYIMAVSFAGGGNQRTLRKPLT